MIGALLPALRYIARRIGWKPIMVDGRIIGWSAGHLAPVLREPNGQWRAASPENGVYRPVASEAHALLATLGRRRWAVRREP